MLASPSLVYDDATPVAVTIDPTMARGLVPRDLTVDPPTMFAPPTDMPDMSFQEIMDRIKEQNRAESSLRHIRRRYLNGSHVPSLDQNGQGYCWAYSNTSAAMLKRMSAGLPYVRLSGHSVACKIMNFKNQGGWCGLAAEFIRGGSRKFPDLSGIASVDEWPEKSMSRSNDNPETWADAALHAVTEDYVDLTREVYDQNLTKKQVLIQLCLNNPCPADFNWWSHSVCGIQGSVIGNPTNPTINDFGLIIWNSWADSYGDLGEAELRGSKSIPDGAVCTRSVIAS